MPRSYSCLPTDEADCGDRISSVPNSSKSEVVSEALCSPSSGEPFFSAATVAAFFSFVLWDDDLVTLAGGGCFGLTNTSSSSDLAAERLW